MPRMNALLLLTGILPWILPTSLQAQTGIPQRSLDRDYINCIYSASRNPNLSARWVQEYCTCAVERVRNGFTEQEYDTLRQAIQDQRDDPTIARMSEIADECLFQTR